MLVGPSFSFAENADLRSYVLQLKWAHQFQFAGYYAALEKGYYREEGLDIVIRARVEGKAPVRQVIDRQADFGISDSSIILHRMRGDPVVVLAVIFQSSPLVIMSLADQGIQGPLDLLGKRIMFQRAVDDALIVALFNELGIGPDSYTYVPHSFDDMALLKGEADAMSAYLSNQPFLYSQAGIEVNLINPANYGVEFYGDNLFTREEVIRKNPDDVLAFRRASLRGWKYALENPQEVAELIIDKYNNNLTMEKLLYEANITRRMIRPRLVEVGNVNLSRFRRIADIYREQGMAPATGSVEGIYYQDYLSITSGPENLLRILVGLIALFILGSIVQQIGNRRLKRAVSERTQELTRAKEEIEQYLKIVDTYTITAKFTFRFEFEYVSDALCRISGYAREQIIGRKHDFLIHPDMDAGIIKKMIRALEEGRSWAGEWMCSGKSGETFFLEINAQPEYEKTVFSGYTMIGVDITDRKRVELLAVTDPLTLLFNRTRVNAAIRSEIKRSRRNHLVFSVILFDLDYFKEINDSYGHPVGDSVLISIASIARQRAREVDLVGRWGGEEFLVVCIDTDINGAVKLAEELRVAIESHTFKGIDRVTASFGVTEYMPGEPENQLLERADKALYQAKDMGRNRVCWLYPEGNNPAGKSGVQVKPDAAL